MYMWNCEIIILRRSGCENRENLDLLFFSDNLTGVFRSAVPDETVRGWAGAANKTQF